MSLPETGRPGGTIRPGMVGAGHASRIEVRALESPEDYAACLQLQKDTWGEHFTELVPPSILKVSQRVGGVAAGAFSEDGRVLGFVFGITGVEAGRLVHWSDMLAVREDARDLGIGRCLKEFQREAVLRLGVGVIYWTFDPLVARNAHFNLNRLGIRVIEYIPDMYGDTDSDLLRGLGTDRFLVAWQIADDDSSELLEGEASPGAAGARQPSVVNGPADDGEQVQEEHRTIQASMLRIRIPADIQSVQAVSLQAAAGWRSSTRRAFLRCLERRYRVTGFYLDREAGCGYYVLHDGHSEAEA